MVEFSNLYSFFDYFERCPLCRRRLSPNVKYIDGRSILLNVSNSDLIIDTTSNSISFPDASHNTIANIYNLCSGYHFYYSCEFDIGPYSISNIRLAKTHFFLRSNETHFVVNTNFSNDTTNVRVTGSNYNTSEITTPAIEFDLSNKKNILKRLSNISLLL